MCLEQLFQHSIKIVAYFLVHISLSFSKKINSLEAIQLLPDDHSKHVMQK